ncbi:MAG: 5-amino-6-(D-ribitylamino)uracil--L-tyrosine 4-hydroxyphenyl transferase CofH [Candidatus Hydrothermarchaeales archaeon]
MFEELIDVDPDAKGVLEKSLEGRRINEEEALVLMDDAAIFSISLVANELRKRKVGDVVTYVVNRNINFTNICIGGCKFCAFRRGKGDPDSYLLSIEEICERTIIAEEAGATEVCIQGGLHPDLGPEFYSRILEEIKRVSDVHIHAFSPMEIHYVAERSGLGIEETLKMLKESGLDSVPGTAAEILDDSIRYQICPHKIKTEEWRRIITTAHKLGIPTTATMLYGHVEMPQDQIRHLKILRDIQDSTSGFTEFVPLSFVHYNTPLYLSGGSKGGATGYEDLKVYAISRIFLDNFTNIQASWVKLGRKLSQLMLSFGANDLGGTLMEENISRSAGRVVEMLDKDELERMILESNRIPKQRDTLYRLVS